MKKYLFLIPVIAGLSYFTLSSNSTGCTTNRSGSDTVAGGANVGCGSFGGGCHGTASTNADSISVVLDSAGTGNYVTKYAPGKNYVIHLIGVNRSVLVLPKFGFQLSVVKAIPYNTLAGTFGTPPANSSVVTVSGLKVLSHTSRWNAAGGTGGAGGQGAIDSCSIAWTAPAAGAGTIKICGAVNMVNNDSLAGPDDTWNTKRITVYELGATGVPEIAHGVTVKAFPNPVTSDLYVELNNAESGTYHVSLFDLNGKLMNTQAVEMNSNSTSVNINVSNYVSGIYQVVVEKDGVSATTPVFKN